MNNRPYLGFGLGLRTEHFEHVLQQRPDVDWFEITSENFMVAGGKPRYYLDAVNENYPLIMHGVSLSVGGSDALDWEYLKQLKTLANHVDTPWFSDHLCWTGLDNVNSHDLLPLPYTEEAVKHVSQRISEVQDFIGRPMLIENVSSYLSYQTSEMTEWQFLHEVCEQADCGILFDVNNVYVSARNHGFEPEIYIKAMNQHRIGQIHLAGHSDYGDYVIDTHDHDVCDPVWDLYAKTLQTFGPITTMIERDDNLPEFDDLAQELNKARAIAQKVQDESSTVSSL